jgi:pyrophosphate--fructose-6-phosphate 1-phosphotransferase
VVAEHSSSTRVLIIHEIMGRHCGWLAAATTYEYLKLLESQPYVPSLGISRARMSVHGVYLPELPFDIATEAKRLRAVMDQEGNANVFLSEGAGVEQIVAEMIARGEEPPRDPFGHVKLDQINPGKWFGESFATLLGADKVLVQKSGYFARAAAANSADLGLIDRCVRHAVTCALRRESGVIGEDEERGNELRAIEFSRIKGGKHFDIRTPWFANLLGQIGQAIPKNAAA